MRLKEELDYDHYKTATYAFFAVFAGVGVAYWSLEGAAKIGTGILMVVLGALSFSMARNVQRTYDRLRKKLK